MLRIRFSPATLAGVRFAVSPLVEAVLALRATVASPAAPGALARATARVRRAAGEPKLAPLLWLLPPGGYVPDFLTSPPDEAQPSFCDELDRLRHVDLDVAAGELRRSDVAGAARAFRAWNDDPRGGLGALADALLAFWRAGFAEIWPTLRQALEADVLARGHSLAFCGPGAVLGGLAPRVTSFEPASGVLSVRKPACAGLEVEPDRRGVVLLPSSFVPRAAGLLAGVDPPWRPALHYAARGTWAWVDGAGGAATRGAFARVVGLGRARVLGRLASGPASTGVLARCLALAPATVSEHLGTLRAAGLVGAHRRGRVVHYRLSEAGARLVELFDRETLAPTE